MTMRKLIATAIVVAAAASPAFAQTHASELIEIPLRVEGGRLLVPLQAPDGTEIEFVLSTGTPTMFSQSPWNTKLAQ